MNIDRPHDIFRGLDPDELLREASAVKTDRRRRAVPLTEEEAAELEGKTEDERAAWLAALPTSEYLARTLEVAGLRELAYRAREGEFHDFLSKHDSPEIELYHELSHNPELRRRLLAGEFDATGAESDAWARSADGQDALRRLPVALRRALRDPYVDVGRNDPCPCGSGAKFKKCHGVGE